MRKDPGSYLDHRFRTRNHMVWGQPLQEIHRKPRNWWQKKSSRKMQKMIRFMHSKNRKYKENQGFLTDRLNRAKPKMPHRGGTSVQGLNLYKIKGLGPPGPFLEPGGSKNAKNQKTSKAEPRTLPGSTPRMSSWQFLRGFPMRDAWAQARHEIERTV